MGPLLVQTNQLGMCLVCCWCGWTKNLTATTAVEGVRSVWRAGEKHVEDHGLITNLTPS